MHPELHIQRFLRNGGTSEELLQKYAITIEGYGGSLINKGCVHTVMSSRGSLASKVLGKAPALLRLGQSTCEYWPS